MADHVRALTALLALLAWISGLALDATVARANPPINWGTGVAVTPPPNAGSDPQVVVTGVSCASATSCTAVGSYRDEAGGTHGLLATKTNGQWSQGIEPALPVNANTEPETALTAVSCASPGNCTAVGHFIDSNNVTQGLIITEGRGRWGVAREVYHPQGARVTTNTEISLTSISCATPNTCAAVGTYLDNTLNPQGLLVTLTAGVLQPFLQAVPPPNAGVEPTVGINSVSCAAPGECQAVGSYADSSGHLQGLLLTQTGGNWQTGVEASPPADASVSASVSLSSVSCSAVGECAAVGSYNNRSNRTEGLLLTDTGGTWQPGTAAALPPGAATDPAVALNSVSCSSTGNCAAVGSYNDTSSNLQGLLLDETNGTWGTGVRPSLPANAGTSVFVQLQSVSCFADANCAAVGNYTDGAFAVHPLLLSESGSGWSPGVEASVPYPGPFPQANIEAVTCVSAGDCTASVDYLDNQNRVVAAAISGTPAAPSNPTLSFSMPPPTTAEASIQIPSADIAATLSGGSSGGTGETGTITFTVFGPSSSPPTACNYGGTVVGTATVQGDGTTYGPSGGGFTPPASGNYWWYANYNGDLTNNPAPSTCGSGMAETVVSNPAVSLTVPSTDAVGTAIAPGSLGATLTGATGAASGTLTFVVYGPQRTAPTICSAGGSDGGTVVGTAPVQGNTTYSPSAGFTPMATGTYWWYAAYSGDGGDPAAASTCGAGMADTIVPTSPTLTLNPPSATGTVGTPVSPSPSAALTGGTAETGTVSFRVFGPQGSPPTSCASGGASAGTAPVQGDGTYAPTAAFVPGAPGDYWWYASYGGDQGDSPAAAACGSGMPETTVRAGPAVSLTAPPKAVAGTPVPGSAIKATLVSGASETGTIRYVVFGPQASPPTACSSGGTSAGTASVSGDGAYSPSDSTSFSAPGDYWWYASYGGDTGNAPAASPCGGQMPVTVVPSPYTTIPTTPTTPAPTTYPLVSALSNVKVHGGAVTVTVTCTHPAGGGPCFDVLTLTVTERLSGGTIVAVTAAKKRRGKHSRTVTGVVTIGSAKLKLYPGQHRTLTIRLNATGKALLKVRHKLTARLQLVQGQQLQSQTVTLRRPAKHRRR